MSKHKLASYFAVLIKLLFVAYPFIIYYALTHFSSQAVIAFLSGVLIIKILFSENIKQSNKVLGLFAVGIFFCISWWLKTSDLALLLPVLINFTLLITFTVSLIKQPSVIWLIASKRDTNLPIAAKSYCDRLTAIWAMFFLLNGLVSLLTVVITNIEIWMLYNGFISYILIGLLMGLEYLYRKRYIAKLQVLSAPHGVD